MSREKGCRAGRTRQQTSPHFLPDNSKTSVRACQRAHGFFLFGTVRHCSNVRSVQFFLQLMCFMAFKLCHILLFTRRHGCTDDFEVTPPDLFCGSSAGHLGTYPAAHRTLGRFKMAFFMVRANFNLLSGRIIPLQNRFLASRPGVRTTARNDIGGGFAFSCCLSAFMNACRVQPQNASEAASHCHPEQSRAGTPRTPAKDLFCGITRRQTK